MGIRTVPVLPLLSHFEYVDSNMPAYVIIRAATRQVLVPGGRIQIPGDGIILGPS